MTRQLSRREVILVIVAFILCVFTFSYMFVFSPKMIRIQRLQAQKSQLRTQLALQKTQKTSVAGNGSAGGTSSPAGTTTRGAGVMPYILPHAADEAGLLQTLYTMSTKANVQMISLQSVQDAKGTTFSLTRGQNSGNPIKSSLPTLHLQITTQGSAAAVEAYLAAIRQNPRLMDVENLSLTSTSNLAQIRAQFDLYAYYTVG